MSNIGSKVPAVKQSKRKCVRRAKTNRRGQSVRLTYHERGIDSLQFHLQLNDTARSNHQQEISIVIAIGETISISKVVGRQLI